MLGHITQFRVPATIAADTDATLQRVGRDGNECFVLWSGVRHGTEFRVQTLHRPRQTAYKLPTGLLVRVDADELHRLNIWMYKNGEELAVQVHSHPTEAFHSDTDDMYPMVAVEGGISIVVPYFARSGLMGPGVAYFRLDGGGWQELETSCALDLFHFEK